MLVIHVQFVTVIPDDAKTTSEANSTPHGISALSVVDDSISESQTHEIMTVTDDSGHGISSANEQLEKSVADDIVESSSPLRNDDDADVMSMSFVFSPTSVAAATTCDGVIPPALSSLPSLMQLSRQALDLRADRSGLNSGDESYLKSPVSCSVTSHVAADMFSEDDNQNDSLAEMAEVI